MLFNFECFLPKKNSSNKTKQNRHTNNTFVTICHVCTQRQESVVVGQELRPAVCREEDKKKKNTFIKFTTQRGVCHYSLWQSPKSDSKYKYVYVCIIQVVTDVRVYGQPFEN